MRRWSCRQETNRARWLKMNQISISIVIPTCNRPNELRECLQALVPQVDRYDDVEFVICDDSSGPPTKTMLEEEFPQCHWYAGPRRGPGGNRNLGAKKANGKWLIFVDDDCLPRPTFVQAYRDHFNTLKDDDRVILEGGTHRIGERPSLLWEAPHNPNGGGLPSCNIGIPKWLYSESGGFDERFRFSFEDMEFAARLERTGVTAQFVKGADVDHPLRPIPNAKKLANRWESRVISSYDFGAKPWQVMYYLPRHALLVILSRFQGQKLSVANLKAAAVFAGEYLILLQKLPSWIRRFKYARGAFWKKPSVAPTLPRRFGL
jgi:GT2 family glycosyltransferase